MPFFAEKKNTECPNGHSVLFKCENFVLNSTPLWRKCAGALGASHYARLLTSRHGATLLTSLESELSDSAALRYLRRRTLCVLRRGVRKLRLRQKKNTVHPNGYTVFLAEMERFELSRRYSRPTPLAGAPLRPLEYISRVTSNARCRPSFRSLP